MACCVLQFSLFNFAFLHLSIRVIAAMLASLLPSLSPTSLLLPSAAGAVTSAVPAVFGQMLGEAAKTNSEPEPPLVAEFASRHGVNDPKGPLNQAGLPETVTDGEFVVHIRRTSGVDGRSFAEEERRIRVAWPDERDGTSLQDVAAALNEIPGLKASIAEDGRLVVMATDKAVRFRFGEDSSGLLAALGVGETPLRQAFDNFVGNALYGQMLAAMRKSQRKPAYFHGGRTEEIFQQQLDHELVGRLTSAQGGQLAEAMYEQQFNALRR